MKMDLRHHGSQGNPNLRLNGRQCTSTARGPHRPFHTQRLDIRALIHTSRITTRNLRIFVHRHQRFKKYQRTNGLTVTSQTVPALLQHLIIARMLHRTVARTVFDNRRLRRNISPHGFHAFIPNRVTVRFRTRHLRVRVTLRRTMSLNHLLTFRLSPTLLLTVVRNLSRPITLHLILRMRHIRVSHSPNSHTT